jgi:membrane protein implicated in regulation of membrane protease activity
MAPVVKQTRVLRNVLVMGVLAMLLLWGLRAWLWAHGDALGMGLVAGIGLGLWRWRWLSGKIARRDRRYARNKIFVHYLSLPEWLLTALAYNIYLLIPLALLGLAYVFWAASSGLRWLILAGGLILSAMATLAVCILAYERRHGRLYYQYNSESWSGAEGLLYQVGTVIEPLQPAGKVTVHGVLWNAVAMSGESIPSGSTIEVIDVQRLTLYVDRVDAPPACRYA